MFGCQYTVRRDHKPQRIRATQHIYGVGGLRAADLPCDGFKGTGFAVRYGFYGVEYRFLKRRKDLHTRKRNGGAVSFKITPHRFGGISQKRMIVES